MLLQIHEPGATPEEDVAVGIDFGTTNSLVAVVDAGKARIISVDGARLTPSVVAYEKGEKNFGTSALGRALESTVHSVKRFLEPQYTKFDYLPYKVAQDPSTDLVGFLIEDKVKTPVEIASDFIRYLKEKAAEEIHKNIYQAVITVPAYYTERARHATRKAALDAGLHVLRLLNEPTAAALAYHLDEGREGNYLVYDLGGGTFDVSLLYMEQGIFQVLAVGGDTSFGGDDIDEALMIHLIEKHGFETSAQLKKYVRSIKEYLGENKEWVGTWCDVPFTVFQSDLNKIVTPFIKKSLQICEETLADAEIDKSSLEDIVLVGGSTRLLCLREAIETHFKKKPLFHINPDEVVALGAAIQAESLVTGRGKLLIDVTPHALGIETIGGATETVIPKNAALPCAITQKFTTSVNDQTRIKIHVLQGEWKSVEQCKSLASFVLSDIPKMPAGVPDLKVTFNIDADGILSVHAEEVTTGVHQAIHIESALRSKK